MASYDQYIAGDAKLDGLFKQINLDELNSTDVSETSDEEGTRNNDFRGDKISADLRQLMQDGGKADRVSVILQVDDVKSGQLADLLRRNGVAVNARMARLGTIKAEVPVKALEQIAARNDVHHLSADSEVRAFGHVSNTTGADAVRQQSTTSAQASPQTTRSTVRASASPCWTRELIRVTNHSWPQITTFESSSARTLPARIALMIHMDMGRTLLRRLPAMAALPTPGSSGLLPTPTSSTSAC